MKRLAFVLVLLPLLLAGPALAAGPLTMSYQGVLMDNGGALLPDGDYSLTFRIYSVASSGSALWTETQNPVAVSRGGFSVVLGSVVAIQLPFDAPYYLGIQVGASAELAPRVRLASSPYAMSVWVPGAVTATSEARLSSFPGGSYYGDGGGYLHLLGDAGGWNFDLEPRFAAGGGAYMYVGGANGSYMQWTGDGGGGGGGSLDIGGSGSASYFRTSEGGDAAVQLPPDAVSAAEILDEPGIAQNHYYGSVYFYTGTPSVTVDILSVSITIPAPGYIVLTADAQFGLFTAGAYAGAQITNVSGAAEDYSHYFFVGGASVSSGTVTAGYVPVSIHRTYYESAAGTYTFYFQGWNGYNATAAYAWDPTLTALYTPTSYGSVVTSATAAELPQFERATATSSAGNGPDQPAVSGSLVDLRELELKVARQQAALEATRRQLIEAQLVQQNAKAAKPAAAR